MPLLFKAIDSSQRDISRDRYRHDRKKDFTYTISYSRCHVRASHTARRQAFWCTAYHWESRRAFLEYFKKRRYTVISWHSSGWSTSRWYTAANIETRVGIVNAGSNTRHRDFSRNDNIARISALYYISYLIYVITDIERQHDYVSRSSLRARASGEIAYAIFAASICTELVEYSPRRWPYKFNASRERGIIDFTYCKS